ncbi:polymer-forming cytoskeletal protein [Mesonia sp. K7]|uniref:bactofilin family protein n=1 Tax=Mesonia sp. K7 TaxID=2218606 RepID=UPI000DA939F9|nr:polymer-forming cytoskeletal protein [Mesonia sp. K7]PZD79084.1 polymer-forming cytoskeletal protein [Mesonia sp. K7]
MFSENKKVKSTPSKTQNSQNKIAQGAIFKGTIEAQGDFRIEGKVEGILMTTGRVVVSKTGIIDGEMQCTNADFEGKLTGILKVKETLSLKSTAVIEGDVTATKLSVEPGAEFNATCNMSGSVKQLNHESRPEQQKEQAEQTA